MAPPGLAGKLLPLLRLGAHFGIVLFSSDATGDALPRLLLFQPQILLVIFLADIEGPFHFFGNQFPGLNGFRFTPGFKLLSSPLGRKLLFLHLLLERLLATLEDGIRDA